MGVRNIFFKRLLFILALISLCAFNKQKDLSGFYYSKDSVYNLTLSNDSTFYFKYRIGYQYAISAGNWRTYDNNLLILESRYMDLLNTPVKVVESKSQEVENSIFFKINSKFIEDSSCFYIITINDSIEVVSTKTLIQLQTIEEITKIKLFYACPDYPVVPYFIRDTVGTVVYYVKDPTSNVYEFEWNVNDELFNYEVFDNDTLDIKNESLYFRSKEIKLIKKK